MKKRLQKIGSLALAGALVLSLTACGGNTSEKSGNGEGAEFKDAKIAVALYADGTFFSDTVKTYIDYLADAMNTEVKYTVFSQTDEAANVATVQQLISSGVDGIIGTMDLGTEAILDECEAAGVYYAGYRCDFETSYTNANEAVFGNDIFLGTVADGPLTDDVTYGQVYFDSLLEYNEAHPDDPIEHVSMALFPSYAFPIQMLAAEQFTAAAEEYNATAETPITVDPLNEEVDVLQFSPLSSTYFSQHPDIDAIMSFAAGVTYIYPTMVSSGVDAEIKLFTSDYDVSMTDNFGSKGTQTFQQVVASPIEAITYPLVLMINRINDVEFSDMPEKAERIPSSLIVVNSDEDMDKMLTNLYSTGEAENAMLSAEDVVNLTAVVNPDATYADLVEAVQSMTIDTM